MPVRQVIPSHGSFFFIALLLITATSCGIPGASYNKAKIRAQEDALVAALRYIREALSGYKLTYGKPPQQLEDLVTAGFFNSLPIDPITNKADWAVEFEPCSGHAPCEKLIKDVHSSSKAKSSKNNLYSEW